ncbi:hypothetical protein Rhal01_03827 [Rubritalea halochordaticola]|uniref:Alpha/beta hydrolase n=1 Tax=Rubritalea halochordaticola TaxID=714537 RepID=A0ABP9V997_9BACT
MYIVTNRNIETGNAGLDVFGPHPSPKGPNELRLVEITELNHQWQSKILDDELTSEQVMALANKHHLSLDMNTTWYASLEVACKIFAQAQKEHKNILFFVHGYNNSMPDVITTLKEIEDRYSVIPVGFSWPANGGGTGAAAYLSDKKDARASCDALNRFIEKIQFYHNLLTQSLQDRLQNKASEKYGDNYMAVQNYYAKLLAKNCKTKLTLVCHSMGNYLMKYALFPSDGGSRKLVFDNVALVAADANNESHELWLHAIQTRNRVYITINEDDYALKWSRRKPGQEQKARLGHYRKGLIARNATYIDVTNASYVGNSHSYFKSKPVIKNKKLHQLFEDIFSGERVDDRLKYHPDVNVYTL